MTILLNNYELAKEELKDLDDSKGKEAMFRSKARWFEQGEKPTKYFFNLEKRNYDRRVIKELKYDWILTNFQEVNKRIKDHFSKILNSRILENENDQRVNFSQFAKEVVTPKLANEEQFEMENDLTMEGIKKVIKLFQRNRTPGDYGFSVKLYEAFLDLLGGNLLDCYSAAFYENQLWISQRRVIIPFVPKRDENLEWNNMLAPNNSS